MIRRRFSDEIAEAIQLEIARLGLQEGDMLPSHAKLAKKLNVSIPSLREGLQTLAMLGVLHIAHGKGTIVTKPNLSDFRRLFSPILRSIPHTKDEVIDVLRILLPHMLEKIDVNGSIFSSLEDLVRTMTNLRSGGHSVRKTEILSFYRLIGKGTGNRLLAQIMETVAAFLFSDSSSGRYGWEDFTAIVHIHSAVVDELRRGNHEEACRILIDFLASHSPGNRPISMVFDTFGSGSIGGSFNSLARDLCTILLYNGMIAIEPEPTGGGIQNVELTDEGQIILGLTQSDVAHAAYGGRGLFAKRHSGIRAICGAQTLMLWILVRKDAGLKEISDLRGKRIAMGAMGGDSGIVADAVLRSYDLNEGDYRPLFLSLSNAVNGLRIGEVDAVFFLASTPQTAIAELALEIPVEILPVSLDVGETIVKGHEYWSLTEIRSGTLPGQSRDVPTLAVPSILITHADVPADIVKRITKVIMEHKREDSEESESLVFSLSTALQGVSIPLHPGAEEYYRECGIAIPDSIAAESGIVEAKK